MSQESYVTKGNAMKDPRQFFLCPLYLKSYRVTKDLLYVTIPDNIIYIGGQFLTLTSCFANIFEPAKPMIMCQ